MEQNPCCEKCNNKDECERKACEEEDRDSYNSDEEIIGKKLYFNKHRNNFL